MPFDPIIERAEMEDLPFNEVVSSFHQLLKNFEKMPDHFVDKLTYWLLHSTAVWGKAATENIEEMALHFFFIHTRSEQIAYQQITQILFTQTCDRNQAAGFIFSLFSFWSNESFYFPQTGWLPVCQIRTGCLPHLDFVTCFARWFIAPWTVKMSQRFLITRFNRLLSGQPLTQEDSLCMQAILCEKNNPTKILNAYLADCLQYLLCDQSLDGAREVSPPMTTWLQTLTQQGAALSVAQFFRCLKQASWSCLSLTCQQLASMDQYARKRNGSPHSDSSQYLSKIFNVLSVIQSIARFFPPKVKENIPVHALVSPTLLKPVQAAFIQQNQSNPSRLLATKQSRLSRY